MEDTNLSEENLTATAGESAEANETQASAPAVEAEVYSPDDSTLERAIKAGMSLADAKALPSKEFADRILQSLEGKSPSAQTNTSNGLIENGEFPAIDLGGVSEENGYDPQIVKAMNSIKSVFGSVIEAQAKVIKQLQAGATAKSAPKAVEVRKNLTLARPGGESGHRRETPANAEADILTQLRDKYKLN